MHPTLEIRRSNTEPKCANCGWWMGGEAPAGKCTRHQCDTLDMALCTAWRDGEISQEILPPERDE